MELGGDEGLVGLGRCGGRLGEVLVHGANVQSTLEYKVLNKQIAGASGRWQYFGSKRMLRPVWV